MFRMPEAEANEYRHFCNNELSAVVDNDGGVCFLNLLDCYYWKNTVYPDENMLPIFSRTAACDEEGQEYGAGIQLYTRETSGRAILHRPTAEQRFTLSYLEGGDDKQTYQLLMESNRLLWECTCASEGREELLLYLGQKFLYRGTLRTHKDQHRGEGSTQSGDHYREAGVELNVDLPELNGTVDVRWEEAPFDAKRGVLLYRGTARYPYCEKTYVVAVGADAPIAPDTARNVTLLRMAWGDRRAIRVGMAIAETEDEAIAALQDGLMRYAELRKQHLESQQLRENVANTVCTKALPFAEAYGRATAAYLDALMVGPTEEGRIGVRASAGKYGFFSLWDTIYPIRDFTWNGRFDDVARCLNYLFQLPAMENTPISSLHLIVEWNEAMAFLPPEYQSDIYPEILKIFRFALRLTEPQYGLLLCKGNTGVDKTEQMGLSGLFLSPDVNALWYSACRIVRNEAICRGDTETVQQATAVIDGVEAGFRRVFFNERTGYFRAGANRDLSPAAVEVHHNSLTLGYDYPYGMYLMRDMVPQLARYQSHELYHPFGHRAVAIDSPIPTGWWKFVHMNQHNGHEMKLQRVAGNMVEVYRVMGETMKRSDRWKIAEETTNFSRFAIHPDQVCDWQSFSATAQMEALRAGMAGVIRHRGGLCYLPAKDSGTVRVENVPMKNYRIAVAVSGSGAFAAMKCAGKHVKGTLQLPVDVICDVDETLQICRTDRRPSYPVLLTAIDLPVCRVTAHEDRTSLECAGTAYTPMLWYAPTEPTVLVNGQPVDAAWDAVAHTVTVDRLWCEGDCVEVILK